jgi:hypothetical protein
MVHPLDISRGHRLARRSQWDGRTPDARMTIRPALTRRPLLRLLPLLAAVPAAAADLPDLGDLQIHGFASQGALKSSGNNYLTPDSRRGTADFNEFGLAVTDRISPELSAGMQIFARDLGNQGNDDPTLDWAYGDYRWRDALGLRAGKIRLPLGLYNESRDLDLARTEVLLPQIMVYNENFRDVLTGFEGAEIYGDLSLRRAGSLDYTVYGGGMQIPDHSSVAALVSDGGFFAVSQVAVKDLWGGQATWTTPLPGLRLGGSFYRVDWTYAGAVNLPTGSGVATLPMASDNRTTIEVASAEYTWHDLTLASEFDHARTTMVNRLSLLAEDDVLEDDWYVLAGYRLNHWLAVAGSFTNEHNYSNFSGPPESTYQRDTALSLRIDPDPHWLIKLEAHYLVGDAMILHDNNPDHVAADGSFHPDQHWWLAAAKTTFSF